MKRVVAALAATCVVALASLVHAPRAGAAEGQPATPTITLGSMPAWVGTGSDFVVGVTLAPEVDAIVVSAYTNVQSRLALERSFDGKVLTSPTSKITVSASAVVAGTTGSALPIGLQAPDAPRDDQRLQVRRTGVYPLRLEARRGNESVGSVVTQLVVVDPTTPVVGTRLNLAMVWPLATAPAFQANGQPDPAVTAQWRPDGRVGRLVGSLGDHPAVPLTLAPSPEMLESWAAIAANDGELASVLGTLRSGLSTPRQTLSSPYVPVDIPSLLANGLGAQVPQEFAAGADALAATVGARADPRTAVVEPVDTSSLDALRATGADRVVVSSNALKPTDERFTNASPFSLDAGGRRFTALASNESLLATITGNDAPAMRAQRFLAWCTVVALEQPNVRRGVVAAMPSQWDVPRELADALLAGLTFNPFIEPATLDSTFGALAQKNDPLARTLQPISPARPAVSATEVRAAESQVDAVASLVGPDDPQVTRGRRQVLTSLTTFWANDRTRARAELTAIDTAIDGFIANIQTPTNRTVTITARKARLPVAILNNTGKTLKVKVSVQSDKLFFPSGSEQTVDLPPRASTVTFIVETRASGTFPLQVDVTSANGQLDVASSKLTVRSTVVSGVGLFLTVGAAVFLAIWWTLHARKTRRVRSVGP